MSTLCAVLLVVIECYQQCIRQARLLEPKMFYSGIVPRQRRSVSILRRSCGYRIE